MQTGILRTLALTAVGNAALTGRAVAGFWPRAAIFRFSKQVEFVVPRDDGHYDPVAADPNAWLAWLQGQRCRGLKLHVAPGRDAGMEHGSERMLVGFVGGGPRWIIETVGRGAPLFWEGFDRIGDRSDPAQKMWLTAYVADGEGPPLATPPLRIGDVADELRDALVAIEDVARADPWKEDFASVFADARAVLDGATPADLGLDFIGFTALETDARRLLAASAAAWVFGGMGSWNDGTPDPPLAGRYDATSEALFSALKWAVLAVANSTYPG